MIQVHCVTSDNAAFYEDELDSYFRWRHLVYVEERGWSELAREDGRERDDFDTDDAVHLLALDDGAVVGGSRIMRACGPTILNQVFPDLVDREAIPRDAETLDWTRMFVVPGLRLGNRPGTVKGAMFCAVIEYALMVGARQVGGVMETFWLSYFARLGLRTRIMGLPRNIAGSMTLAAFIQIDEAALTSVRAATGWATSLLVTSHREPLRRVS